MKKLQGFCSVGLNSHEEKVPLGNDKDSNYYCNVIQEVWLIVSTQDEDLAYRFLEFLAVGQRVIILLSRDRNFQSHYSCDLKWICGMYADPSATVWGVEMA